MQYPGYEMTAGQTKQKCILNTTKIYIILKNIYFMTVYYFEKRKNVKNHLHV